MNSSGKGFAWDIGFVDTARDTGWPAETPAGIRRYLTALARQGAEHFMSNAAGVTVEVLRVGESVVPVVISDGRAGKASILSPFGHHIRYPVEEISRGTGPLGRVLLRAAVAPLALALKLGSIDRVVLVNHWLLSGCPPPDVPDAAWEAVIRHLSARFPDHALVVQDLKPELQPTLAQALTEAGGLAVPTRVVQVLDPRLEMPGKAGRKKRYRRVVARRIIEETQALQRSRDVARSQTARLTELYRTSNIFRHSALNPGYSPAFFDLVLGCDEFHLQAWAAADGPPDQIVAFNIQRLDARFIHWSTFGREEPASDAVAGSGPSLYEYVTAADIVTAERTGLLLDWGAGATEFKRLRGAVPYQQVEVAFVGHLAAHRRAAWQLLAWLRQWRSRQIAGAAVADTD